MAWTPGTRGEFIELTQGSTYDLGVEKGMQVRVSLQNVMSPPLCNQCGWVAQ